MSLRLQINLLVAAMVAAFVAAAFAFQVVSTRSSVRVSSALSLRSRSNGSCSVTPFSR